VLGQRHLPFGIKNLRGGCLAGSAKFRALHHTNPMPMKRTAAPALMVIDLGTPTSSEAAQSAVLKLPYTSQAHSPLTVSCICRRRGVRIEHGAWKLGFPTRCRFA
jgi:hypothetical protein